MTRTTTTLETFAKMVNFSHQCYVGHSPVPGLYLAPIDPTHSTGWTTQCSNSGRENIFFCSPTHPNRLWGQPSNLFNGYRRRILWR